MKAFKAIPALLALFLVVGCASKPVAPTKAEQVAESTVKFKLERLPPLDLSAYKTVKYQVVDRNDGRYIFMSVDDYQAQEQLLKVLESYIGAQNLVIEKYEKGFSPSPETNNASDRPTVPDVNLNEPGAVHPGR